MPTLPEEMVSLPRSGIRAVMDLAWAQTGSVIRLEVGQPDVSPPPHITEAMAAAVLGGETRYTPNAGIGELREAVAAKLMATNGVTADPERVLITAGAMQGLSAVTLGLLESGDEILVPDPGWPNYSMMASIAKAKPVPYRLHAADDFLPDPEEVAAKVTGRTRMMLLNSPSNPLGTVVDRARLSALVDLAEVRDMWILSDECYDQIVFEMPVAPSPAVLAPDRVVTVHSFSKTYAMTGLRVGYVAGPQPVVSMLTKLQEALVACVNGPAQRAALTALTGSQEFVSTMQEVYRRRRDEAVAAADSLGLPRLRPEGAFYLWLPLQGQVTDSMAFCRRLIAEHGVAVAPGDTFGAEGAGAVRVSLAASAEDIVTGLQRIAAAL